MDDNDLCSFCSGLVLSQIDGVNIVVIMMSRDLHARYSLLCHGCVVWSLIE